MTLKRLLRRIKYPDLLHKNNSICIIDNIQRIIATVWQNKMDQPIILNKEQNIDSMKYEEYGYPLEVSVSRDKNVLEVKIHLDLYVPYLYIEYEDKSNHEILHDKIWAGLVLWSFRMYDNGNFQLLRLDKILDDEMSNLGSGLSFRCKWTYMDTRCTNTFDRLISIKYLRLKDLRYLDYDTVSNSTLLIPGPIPFTSVSNEQVFLSEGYDVLLMPFRNIVCFSYPGRNFKYLRKQINIYNDLFSDKQSSIAIKDFAFSKKYTHFKRIGIDSSRSQQSVSQKETVESITDSKDFDSAIIEDFLDEEKALIEDRKETIKIKDILKNIAKEKEKNWSQLNDSLEEVADPLEFRQHERVKIEVEFDYGIKRNNFF